MPAMNELPLVSVIVPCYNAEVYLESAIRSITEQTYTNLEIICVNDGSKDATGEILERLAAKDRRIRVVHNEKNLKLIGTLNKAIDLARGALIARMDADDVSLPRRIEEQVRVFMQNPDCDVVSMAVSVINHEGRKLGRITDFDCTGNLACKFVALFNPPVNHPAIMLKADVMKAYRYRQLPSVIHVEDYDLWARLMLDNKAFHNIQEPLFLYRLNNQGISLSNRSSQGENHLPISKKILAQIVHMNLNEDVLRVIDQYAVSKTAGMLFRCHKDFRSVKNAFVDKYRAALTGRDRHEINKWYLQRVIFMNFISVRKGSLPVKLAALLLTCAYPQVLFYKATYQNFLLQLNILLYR
jgi:glycosyltransferase involved in cell wall biosynthesis